jgi:hypothetical protein
MLMKLTAGELYVRKNKFYWKLVETFHVASECKTAISFSRCLVHLRAQWSTVFPTVRML